MMKIGYARVSTHEQTLDLQLDALKQAGCDQLHTDTVSGLKDHRPNWDKTFSYARAGDTIVVWRLDRIGRGHTDLLRIVEAMQQRQINLKTLTGIEVDTSTPTGKLLFRIVAAMIEYERDQMRERTLAGLAAARARGKQGGGKPVDPRKMELARKLYADKTNDIGFICRTLKISRATLYRYLQVGRKAAVPQTTA
jgi:DNA invertase Pin-like site-specific DNA recombinase